MARLTGGCLCGETRYVIDAAPLACGACHCRDCQYVSGGNPAQVLVLEAVSLAITKGTPQVFSVLSEAGNRVSRFFCGTCGTHLFRRGSSRPHLTVVTAGSLDDPSAYRPQAHAWTRSARPWHAIDHTLPRFACEPPSRERDDAA